MGLETGLGKSSGTPFDLLLTGWTATGIYSHSASHRRLRAMWYTLLALATTTALLTFVVLRQRLCDDLRPPRREWYEEYRS